MLSFYSTKIQNNIVESLSCTPGASPEHKEDSRVKPIAESKIGLQLEFDPYSSD